ncbi:HNH endonuclease [Arthrobacter phage Elesar]|uniref:HNH endonuclease n=1 Tax=Arthrobacter phage Elesar TaxID=2510522 RepID=A0A411CQA9_9CAUD|nr:HNH endonuclease [Arthrobacter phage Elesar]QAY16108.1 HNH endonuclease [Arthrobacter phage Elesar]
MFFQIDDQFHVNQKAKVLARKALMNDVRGLAALGLWSMAGSMCQAALTDGVTTVEDLVSITLNYGIAIELADHLVSAGLWHSAGHSCERCPEVAEGTYLYHDWFALNYDTGEQVRTTRGKRKELKDPTIIAAVWARDCIDDPANPAVGLCRYCQVEVRRQDRKSDIRPEMDHVVPNLYCGPRNIVLACLACNRKKGARTPEQAGMTLHPAPRSQEPAGASEAISPAPAAAETVQTLAGPAAEPTTEQIRPEYQTDPAEESDLISEQKAIPVGARTGTRPGGAGQGGVPEGLRDGVTPAHPSPKPSRRRRRGKGTTAPAARRQQEPKAPASTEPHPKHDAGEAPTVTAPGRFGSPWHGWSGKPSTVTETTCIDHQQEQPCRQCQEDSGK